MDIYINFCLKNFYLISLFLIDLLWLIFSILIRQFRNKNEELFKSMSYKKFCELVLNRIFIEDDDVTMENKVKFDFKDISIISFFFSVIPVLHFFVLCELIIFTSILFSKDKSLKKIYETLNKDVSSNEDSLSNENKNILLLKKYNKDNNIENIITAITNKSHPHKEIIKDNLTKLIELIKNKELESETTFSDIKKKEISNEIDSIITKYIALINGISENLITEDLLKLNDLYKYMKDMQLKLNSKALDLNDILKTLDINFISKYEKMNDYNIDFINGTIDYIERFLNNDEYIKVKKILSNNNTIYYKNVSNLIVCIADTIRALDSKLEFLPIDIKEFTIKNINDCLLIFRTVIIELDILSPIISDKNIDDYNNLIDSILEDVKNKKAVF